MTYGNLAYQYDYTYGDKTAYRTKEKNQNANQNTVKKQSKGEKRKVKKISFAAKTASIVVLTVSAIIMIVQFVEVKETMAALDEAMEQYDFELSITSQKNFELEQSIDLSKIEQEATTRLGMKRPDRHQIVYIDVPKDDVTETTAVEVEGLRNRLVELGKSLISHIVAFFSI